MRLPTFMCVFFLCVAVVFGSFLWCNRVELISRTLERAIPPYHIALKRVEMPNTKTVVLYDLQVFSQENELIAQISQLTLASSRKNWLYWLLTPTTAPLKLDIAAMTLSLCPVAMTFNPAQVFLPVEIDTTICYTGKTTKVLHQVNGSFQGVIETLFLSPPTHSN